MKGLSTLYKVWGIITYIFAAFYGIAWIVIFIIIRIASSRADRAASGFSYAIGNLIQDRISSAQKYFVFLTLVLAAIVIIGFAIRIIAGTCLCTSFIESRGVIFTVVFFYFIITVINLVSAIVCGKTDFIGFSLFFVFCTGWGIATGVLLILKQNVALVRKGGVLNGPLANKNMNYFMHGSGRASRHRPIAVNEGLFGDFAGRKYMLRPGERCTIGREPGCNIQILHRKVSRIHCYIKFLPDGRFEVTDNSSNGTFYENVALHNGVATTVKAGGNLVIGEADNVMKLYTE